MADIGRTKNLPRGAALAGALASVCLGFGAHAQQSPATTTAKPAATTGSAAKPSEPAMPRESKPSDKPKGDPLAAADRSFMVNAAQDGMAEVELGRIAQQKAGSAQVKQLAARIVADHGKANDELKSIAGGKGVTLPAQLDKARKAHVDKLQKLSAADFDKTYAKHMVEDHQKTIAKFRKTAKEARDADVKGFAAKTLPTLEEHLKLAQAADAALKGAKK